MRRLTYFLGCAGDGIAASALAEPCGLVPSLGAAVFGWAVLSMLCFPPPSPQEVER